MTKHYQIEVSPSELADLVDALDEITSDKGREHLSSVAPRFAALRARLAGIWTKRPA